MQHSSVCLPGVPLADSERVLDEHLLSVGSDRAHHLVGRTGAYARLASQVFDDGFGSDRFARLAYAGARRQQHLCTAADRASISVRSTHDSFVAHSIITPLPSASSRHHAAQVDASQEFGAAARAADISGSWTISDWEHIIDVLRRIKIATELAGWDELRGVVRDQLALIPLVRLSRRLDPPADR